MIWVFNEDDVNLYVNLEIKNEKELLKQKISINNKILKKSI